MGVRQSRLGVGLAMTLIVCLIHTNHAGAQTAATIVGDITDGSGAVAPNVSVTVINEGTKLERKVQTNEAGQYRVTPLNPGTYTIQIEAAGFRREVRTGVVLEVSAVLEVDFRLQVGEVTDTIGVTGVTPVLQAEDATVGSVVNSKELQHLPVNERNYTRLILLMPGTSSVSRSQQQGNAQSGTALFSVNGGRPQDNNFTLDGVDSNMQMMNSPGISPPMDAIQEFKVATNTGSEFGRSMGANISMVMKSGTRDLHGTVYEYLRNDLFDANEFFANRNGLGKTPFRLNQYGVTLGGPVMLPKANVRDKMFWFFSWEGFRRRRGSTLLTSVPTEAFRNGNFSSLLTGNDPIYIRDPLLAGNCDAADQTACFPNNVIPQARINQAIPKAMAAIVPLPNRPGETSNLVSNRSVANDRDLYNVRWDYSLNSSNSFNFRYSHQNADLREPQSNPTFTRLSQFDVTNYGGGWVHVFGPTTTLDVGFGYNHPDGGLGVLDKPISRTEFLDLTGIAMYQREVYGDPLVNIGFGAYSTGGGGAEVIGDRIWQTRANLTMVRGKHSWKFGGQYHYRKFYTNTGNPMDGNADFSGVLTGFPMADALLGYPSEIRRGQGNTLTDGIGNFALAYVSDDWRISQNLTLNLGLMYQLAPRPHDSTGRLGNLWVHRDDSGRIVGDLMWATTNPEIDPVTGRRNEPARTFGFGSSLIQNDYNDFAPRVGIAYKLGSKTVIRSGFGIFYNSTFVQELQDLRKFWPFTIQQVFSPNRGALDLSITDAGPSFSNTSEIGGWPQNPENRSPYSMQWNFFIQRELMNDISLDIGYVGSGSRKQIGYAPFNNALTPGPGPINPRRLLPQFGDLDGGSNQYNGSYNSLQVSVLKRFSKGLLINTNYSWQKSLDGQSSLAEGKTQNPFDRRADYSRSSWDVNHVFNFSYVYELPLGKGRRFGARWGRAAEAIFGGWTLQGLTRLESGPPVFIGTGQDIANTGRSSQRPNLVGDPNAGPKTPDEWFNTKAFAVPAPFTFGNAGQYITNADGMISIDMALEKKFKIREGHALEFKTEFFNVPNTVNFGSPEGSMNNSNFGRITSQRTNPRQIQFTLRYRF
ncbi:MAG TPA: carboxypeptidase-like regulatory domain-containing protein [Blastocatellia bacterium]|nr:carboxypeptidase-like regulatory domain-containing protein [Blastocatellia bacterium]